jgi:hypothetical protein
VCGSLGAFVPNPPLPVAVAPPVITGMDSVADVVDVTVGPVFEIVGWAAVSTDVVLLALLVVGLLRTGILIVLDEVLSANDRVEKNKTVSVDAKSAQAFDDTHDVFILPCYTKRKGRIERKE